MTGLQRSLAHRLEEARKESGFKNLRVFLRAMTSEGYEISYQSILNYHGHRQEKREPPLSYLLRVSEVTGVRLEWLATGQGPMAVTDPGGRATLLAGVTLDDGRTIDLLAVLLGGHGAEVLPRAFRDELPDLARDLSAEAILSLQRVCAHVAPGEDTDNRLMQLGRCAGGLLLLPAATLRFKGHPSGHEYTDYALTVSSVLMQAVRMAAEGERTAGQTKQQGEGDQT